MAALDALPELRNSEELKSKLLFSVVVVSPGKNIAWDELYGRKIYT